MSLIEAPASNRSSGGQAARGLEAMAASSMTPLAGGASASLAARYLPSPQLPASDFMHEANDLDPQEADAGTEAFSAGPRGGATLEAPPLQDARRAPTSSAALLYLAPTAAAPVQQDGQPVVAPRASPALSYLGQGAQSSEASPQLQENSVALQYVPEAASRDREQPSGGTSLAQQYVPLEAAATTSGPGRTEAAASAVGGSRALLYVPTGDAPVCAAALKDSDDEAQARPEASLAASYLPSAVHAAQDAPNTSVAPVGHPALGPPALLYLPESLSSTGRAAETPAEVQAPPPAARGLLPGAAGLLLGAGLLGRAAAAPGGATGAAARSPALLYSPGHARAHEAACEDPVPQHPPQSSNSMDASPALRYLPVALASSPDGVALAAADAPLAGPSVEESLAMRYVAAPGSAEVATDVSPASLYVPVTEASLPQQSAAAQAAAADPACSLALLYLPGVDLRDRGGSQPATSSAPHSPVALPAARSAADQWAAAGQESPLKSLSLKYLPTAAAGLEVADDNASPTWTISASPGHALSSRAVPERPAEYYLTGVPEEEARASQQEQQRREEDTPQPSLALQYVPVRSEPPYACVTHGTEGRHRGASVRLASVNRRKC